MPPRSTPNFYALLKVERAATNDQIERAFDTARHTALSDGAGPELIELIEQAFLTLSDPATRREHDAALDEGDASSSEAQQCTSSGDHGCILVAATPAPSGGDGASASIETVLESAHPFYSAESSAPFSGRELLACQASPPGHADGAATRPPSKPPVQPAPRSTPPRGTASPSGSPQRAGDARDADAAAAFTGSQLRRIREARGLSLQELSELTKVSLSHLENIEAERFALLPPPVYLRGFLMLIARALRIDPLRVTKEFLDQMSSRQG